MSRFEKILKFAAPAPKRPVVSILYSMSFLPLLFLVGVCFGQEICNNGIDDDGDGLVDLQDPYCSCHYDVNANLLQNGSFETFQHCPTNAYSLDYKIADAWQFGTYVNGNEAGYYHNFVCSYDSSSVMLYMPPALPLPDGNAFVSIRQYVYTKPQMKETDIAKIYVGQCLGTPLIPSEQYTLSFSAGRFQSHDDTAFRFKDEPFTVALFGNRDCNAVPFGKAFANSNGCPANYPGWIFLGKAVVHSKGLWVQDKINFTVPENINVIEIGPDCSILDPAKDLPDSTTLLDFYMYYLDDVHLLRTKDFPFQYINAMTGSSCSQPSALTVPDSPNSTYQWYRDSVAIAGATSNSYLLPGYNPFGHYNVRINNNGRCKVSEPFSLLPNVLSSMRLPSDTSFCDSDTLVLANKIAGITYKVNGRSETVVKITEPGNYEIVVSDQNGCSKSFNVAVHPDNCSANNLFIPNSFTPNNDGTNDLFRIPPAANIDVKSFLIFDRWGKKVFDANATDAGWDGKVNGQPCPEGTYVYVIKGRINNKLKTIRGIVFLIR